MDAVLKATKGNRVVRIPKERMNDYIAMGYKITTRDGEVIHEPIKTADLQAKVKELTKQLEQARKDAVDAGEKIEALWKENEELKAENEKLKKASDAGKQAKTEAKATE